MFLAFHLLWLTDIQARELDLSAAPLPFPLVLLAQKGRQYLRYYFIFDLLFNYWLHCKLMFCAFCLRSLGNFGLLRHWSIASQPDEYEITLTSSLSVSLSLLMSHEGLNGWWLSVSAALLEWPVQYLMTKWNNASHYICDAPNLLSRT